MSIDTYHLMGWSWSTSVSYSGDSEYRGGMGLRGRGVKSNPIISHLEDKGVRSQCVALSYIHRLERIQ